MKYNATHEIRARNSARRADDAERLRCAVVGRAIDDRGAGNAAAISDAKSARYSNGDDRIEAACLTHDDSHSDAGADLDGEAVEISYRRLLSGVEQSPARSGGQRIAG